MQCITFFTDSFLHKTTTFIDLETTSLHPFYAEIVSAYLITDNSNREQIGELEILAKPKNWSYEAEAIHGITKNQAGKGVSQREAFISICSYLRRYNGSLVLHANDNNSIQGCPYLGRYYFDLAVLKSIANELDYYYAYLGLLRQFKVESTHYLAKQRLTLRNYKLRSIADSFGLKYLEHNAKSDTIVTRQIYYKLQGSSNGLGLFN